MSIPSLKELEARWRATNDPGEPIGSKGAFRRDTQIECADELATLREAMRAEVETWPHDPSCQPQYHPTSIRIIDCRRCAIVRFIEGEP